MMVFTVVSARPVRQWLLVITVRFIAFSMAFQQDRSRTVRDVSGRLGGPSGSVGLCTIGPSTACCLGWRNVMGVCQRQRPLAVCNKPCRNGVCVGLDKCSCSVGYKGQQCDQDVNECGLPERPCSNSCMNTQGSYRCYCDPGYNLMTDGSTCTKELECSSASCQFACQIDRVGEVHCLCALGLHLAADNRTCEDKDECLDSTHLCSRHS